MEGLINFLDGVIMPVMLIICGLVLAKKIKLWKIVSPGNFFKTLKNSNKGNGTSPVRSLCTALAGTLGVGNMAGVATAITAGGAGAVMWMWIGAVVSMSVKYGEVALGVKYRKCVSENTFVGGSMYTIKRGLKKYIGIRSASVFGGVFAALCIINSLITGNLVQVRSASGAIPEIPPLLIGCLVAMGIFIVAYGKAERISSFTYVTIPILSAIYILLSMSVIIRNINMLPEIIVKIINEAFSFKAAAGGALGGGVRMAVRYGITRGIFSNEAGSGTAPTAHASADTRSPHHQGCFGIFEVIADTLILCSMTAFVILIAEAKFGPFTTTDGIELTLIAFETMLGPAARMIIAVSVILFAFATVVAQIYYGSVALDYFYESKRLKNAYIIMSAGIAIFGVIVGEKQMWIAADLIIGVMTTLNVSVLLIMRKEIAEISPVSTNRN